MNFNEKKKYVAPEMEVIDMEYRTILCDNSEPPVLPIVDDEQISEDDVI